VAAADEGDRLTAAPARSTTTSFEQGGADGDFISSRDAVRGDTPKPGGPLPFPFQIQDSASD
jgi:hypothetical protein